MDGLHPKHGIAGAAAPLPLAAALPLAAPLPLAAALVAAALLLATASGSWAQGTLSARLQTTGLVQLSEGDAELATIELNAHGLQWKNAPQTSATAEVGDLPGNVGKRFVGTLPIANTEGGVIRFIEGVRALPQSLQLEYDLEMATAMRLNGVQVSVFLPVARYAGKRVTVRQPNGDPQVVSLPLEQQEQAFQLFAGQGDRIEAAEGDGEAITLQLRAPTDVIIQDLRRWDRPVFEVRFPAIMEDQGREVAAGDRLHLDLAVAFATPVKLEGP